MNNELDAIRNRYARREQITVDRYSPLDPAVYMTEQEKERKLIRWIYAAQLAPLADKHVLEIGCGSGGNLFQLIRLGFRPEHLVGNDLLEERVAQARARLPASVRIISGDAATLDLGGELFDVVLQSTVFTSILDNAFQQQLAERMWQLVQPGGGVLWYDFIYKNPANPDVRGVPVKRIRTLFPEGHFTIWTLTLAPPISRRVTRLHPALYTMFNLLPVLRTHVLCWIAKPALPCG